MDFEKADKSVDDTKPTIPSDKEAPSIQVIPISPTFDVPSWARFVPGPSPQHCFRGLPASACRVGVVLIGCFIFGLSGTNVSLMGSVSSVPSYLDTVGLNDSSSNTQLLVGVVNSIYWVGVVIGALLVGWFSDRVGRRRALVVFGIYGIAIIPVLASLQTFSWVLVLRLLNGLFTGAFDSVGLNWAAESVDARHRGLAIGSQLVCAASGAGIVYFIIYGLSNSTTGDVIWRFPMAFQLFYVLTVLSLVYFLPESPRWLAKVGYHDEARQVLELLRGQKVHSAEEATGVEIELQTILNTIEAERAASSSCSYWSMFMKRDKLHIARRTWSALLVQFGTQAMVGSGVVAGYGIKIFETGGWTSNTASLLTGFVIFTQAVFGVPGALFSDRIGRRRAMVFGAAICGTLLALIGMCGYYVDAYKVSDPAKAKAFSTATVALLLSWSAFYGMTWLWCPFTYPSEIFPASSRSRGSSVGIIGLASGSFVSNMISSYLFERLAYKALFLFCGLSLLMSLICYLWMPETANKKLEAIGDLYDHPYRSFKVKASS